MNRDNYAVVICAYQGDAGQVESNWPSYIQHGVPVLILSPEDSPVYRSGAWCISAGKRAYIGPDSLDRQWAHLNLLRSMPFDYFLVHDADSILLSPDLPDYLFTKNPCLWSNVVSDEIHKRPEGYTYPRLAFQSPYFFSRETLIQLTHANVPYDEKTQTPYIDWYMSALAAQNGVPFSGFIDGASCPTSECPVGSSTPGQRHAGYDIMYDLVRNKGVRFCHSIKDAGVFDDLCKARTEYLIQQ